MGRPILVLALILLSCFDSVAQLTLIKVACAPDYGGKFLTLGTYRDNGTYKFLDSLRIDRDTVVFRVSEAEMPDLYFLSITGGKSSLSFFPEKGSTVILDGNDPIRSDIVGSGSQADWKKYLETVQIPYESDLKISAEGEKRARSASDADSLTFWSKNQQSARRKWLGNVGKFVDANPKSFVSLYLVRTNWQYFKEKGTLERLSADMAYHQSYRDLQTSLAESTGKVLPNFQLLDYNGSAYTRKNFEGKYLVIDFWGTWCQPCIESIPLLREAYLELKANKQVVFISIANEQSHTDPQKVAKTAAKLGIEWVQLIEHLSDPHSLSKKLGIKGFPTLLIVNQQDEIIRESLGDGIPDTLVNLKSLLKL